MSSKSDCNPYISAPTGSGKTVIFELAILRAVMNKQFQSGEGRSLCVYVAPLKVSLARDANPQEFWLTRAYEGFVFRESGGVESQAEEDRSRNCGSDGRHGIGQGLSLYDQECGCDHHDRRFLSSVFLSSVRLTLHFVSA